MTKTAIKKQKKRQDILNSAYHLFTTIGFTKTTILGIALGAGVAKGTFYLYYNSKDEVRDDLIIRKAAELLKAAIEDMKAHRQTAGNGDPGVPADSGVYALPTNSGAPNSMDPATPDKQSGSADTDHSASSGRTHDVADSFIYVCDYILTRLAEDKTLLQFVSKNLSWGFFNKAHRYSKDNDDEINIRKYVEILFQESNVQLRNPEILIYTILEMINSTCYSVLIYDDPIPFEEYKPHLYHYIRILVNDAVIGEYASGDDSGEKQVS